MRQRAINILALACMFVLCACLIGVVHAQIGPTPTPPVPLDLVGKVALIAGIITTILQGVKKFLPSLGGTWAVVINVALALAITYSTNPMLNIQFAVTAVMAALSAAGVHSFLRPAGIASSKSPFAKGAGS